MLIATSQDAAGLPRRPPLSVAACPRAARLSTAGLLGDHGRLDLVLLRHRLLLRAGVGRQALLDREVLLLLLLALGVHGSIDRVGRCPLSNLVAALYVLVHRAADHRRCRVSCALLHVFNHALLDAAEDMVVDSAVEHSRARRGLVEGAGELRVVEHARDVRVRD